MANVSSSNSQKDYPQLRLKAADGGVFPAWKSVTMGQLYQERKTPGNETLPILSVSIHTGVSDGSLDEDELGKRVKRSEDKSLYKQALTGDLVFNMMRAWQGAIGVVKTPGMVSPAYIVAEPNEGVYPPFMDFLFSTPQMINRIHRLSYGVTDFRLRLYWDSFVSIDCRIPQVDEQMKIAQFLSKIEQKIDAQQRLINALKSYKRGLVFALFKPDNRFRIEMVSVPMTALLTEYRCQKSEGLRVCSVAVNKGIVDQVEHLGRSFSAADTSHYGRVKPGDIVYTKSPTGNFPFGIVKQSKMNEEVAVSPLYGVYTPRTPSTGALLHIYFEQSENANNYIRTLAQKGAKNTINITSNRFLEKSILFPAHETDCVTIAGFFDTLDQRITLEEQALNDLERQKRGLLSKMFI